MTHRESSTRKPTEQQKSQAVHHVMWSASELMHIHDMLKGTSPLDGPLTNALVHAAAMHTRNLIEFFTTTTKCAKGQGGIVANHYTDNDERHIPPPEDEWWQELYNDASIQVAHIGINRVEARDVAEPRHWAKTEQVQPLARRVCDFVGKQEVRDYHAQASFNHIDKIEIEHFRDQVRKFIVAHAEQASDGASSASDQAPTKIRSV